jgi:hypothetical protein
MSNAEHTQSPASAVFAPAHPSHGAGRTNDISETRTAAPAAHRGHIGLIVVGSLATGLTAALRRARPGPVIWGAVWGALQAASPLGFWWLAPKTVYALGLTLIAAVYIGFSVADGRWKVIATESSVAAFFVVIAAVSVSGSAWLLVLGLAGHGLKDLWQHRTQFVQNTRGWPPFCATVDWVAAGILTTAIVMGIPFHG